MSTFLIIMTVVLILGVRTYKGVRKFATDSEVLTSESVPQTARPAFESLFDEEDGQKGMYTFEQEEQSAGYFTYETAEPVVVNKSSKKTRRKQMASEKAVESRGDEYLRQVSVAEDSEYENQGFDLRQAVIYQTILNNKYSFIFQ